MPGRHLYRRTTDGLAGATAAARRGMVRLVPAERREWAEAVWVEAREVPPGWQRLAWRAGGVRLIAKESQMVRRVGTLVLFASAAAAAAWAAWPKSSVESHSWRREPGRRHHHHLAAGRPAAADPLAARTAR